MTQRHTISKAGLIYGGDVVLPGHSGGRIGAPMGTLFVRLLFEGLNAGTVVQVLNASSPVGVPIPINQDLAYREKDYETVMLGPVVSATSVGNETGKKIKLWGADGAGWPVTKEITLANAGAVETPIGWSVVTAIQLDTALVNTVTLATIAKDSLPYRNHNHGGDHRWVYLDGSQISSPSISTGRTVEDTITGADARGILDLTGETVSDSKLHFSIFIDRYSTERAIGLRPYTDRTVANFVS